MSKVSIDFEGFNELIAKFKKLEMDYKKPLEDTLYKEGKNVSKNLERDMKKHYRTGKTADSITIEKPEWRGDEVSFRYGFEISNGGLPSIFLMYGTPRMKKDTKLYNDVYGKKVRESFNNSVESALYDAIRKAGF